MRITFVIPVFNEEETLVPLAEGIAQNMEGSDFEVLFVDDGSTDRSFERLQDLEREHPFVKVLRLRGNFGKSTALAAGFAHCEGDLVFTMDSDLQDDPKEIPRFLEKLEQGYDMVCGWKATRHDPWHKTGPSRVYNQFVSWLFDLPIHDVNCGYKLMRREVVQHLRVYGELHRLIPVMAHHLNFRVTEIPVEHHRRQHGHSKYGLERFSRGAFDVLTMWFLTRYRHQPGHFFGKLGAGQSIIGLLAALVGGFLSASPIAGGLFILGLMLVATGGVTVCLGLLAELMLHHFMRMDAMVYISEEEGRD